MSGALIIGGGSIAVRHARLLADRGLDVALVTSQHLDGVTVYPSVGQGMTALAPDYAVVANATVDHASAIEHLLDAGFSGRLLIEKPAAVQASIGSSLLAVGVGFNLRFHPVVQRLRDLLVSEIGRDNVIQVEAYAGQWLEDWRPGRPTSSQYSAHASAGGGVLRDLSHELDLVQWLVGPVTGVFARGGRCGNVTIDSDDAWSLVMAHGDSTTSSVQLNYFDRPGDRRIRVIGESATLEADLRQATISINGVIEHYSVDRDESYRAMHEDMLGAARHVASLLEAAATDALVADIERSALSKAWVER